MVAFKFTAVFFNLFYCSRQLLLISRKLYERHPNVSISDLP